MIHQVASADRPFEWLDLSSPSPSELDSVCRKYDIHRVFFDDCLEPGHLPKCERLGKLSIFVLRAYDTAAAPGSDTYQTLTREVGVFVGERFLITLHGSDLPATARMREKWTPTRLATAPDAGPRLLSEVLESVIATYENPIHEALNELDRLEVEVFDSSGTSPFKVTSGYMLKRKAFVFKRILHLMRDLITKISADPEIGKSASFLHAKEQANTLYFYAEDLMEGVNTLLNLHISLSSQRTNEASHQTNEVVRVLTIFSIFLLPLNVITGIYGMNFDHMPELHWKLGYPLAIASMWDPLESTCRHASLSIL